MRRELQPYERRRVLPTLLLWVILWSPVLVMLAIDASAWRRSASPLAVNVALAGAGIGLYAVEFALLFVGAPHWIRERADEHTARRWQYAALNAGVTTGPMTAALVVSRLFRENTGVGIGVGIPAGLLILGLMAWLGARHFPEVSGWMSFRPKR